MNKSKNDESWQKIFEKYKLLEKINDDGHFYINANDINEFRQARLMTKFDHRSQLPKIFSENNLSILPISRGGYIIGGIQTFKKFEENDNEIPISRIDFPNYLESLNYREITSESMAVNSVFVSKILHDFTGEDELFPTVSGRMSSSCFSFHINSGNKNLEIKVDNSQIEIDGGYEGHNSLNIIEAKNYISKDFIVRQLYYPYRLWSNKINKKVRPIFLTYTNGIFHLREYLFEDIGHYNSIKLVAQKRYAIEEATINIEIVQELLYKINSIPEPYIPFPQADSFERVINLCELLKQRTKLSKEEITINYDFDERQTNYYTDAGRYLGLIEKAKEDNQVVFFLSQLGVQIFTMPLVDRQLEFIRLILNHDAFRRSLNLFFEKGEPLDKTEIIEIMKSSNLYNVVTEKTFFRRASTISGWINWILNQIDEG